MMLVRWSLLPLLPLLLLFVLPTGPDSADLAYGAGANKMVPVKGRGCQSYDGQSADTARHGAELKALEDAIRKGGVYLSSYRLVMDNQMQESVTEAFSAGRLENIEIVKTEPTDTEICLTVRAQLDRLSLDDVIKRLVDAKAITKKARNILVPAEPKFDLKIWTNKPDGRFVENDNLIVYVRSERDTYLTLDYFGASGRVFHLVPTMYRNRAFIEGGKTYSFGNGEEGSPEHFRVGGTSFGPEIIVATTTAHPVPSETQRDHVAEDSYTYLDRLGGVKNVQAKVSIEITTESLAVHEYKKHKNTLVR